MAFEIKGFASIFGNVDLEGDVILPGAFSKSLERIGPSMKVPLFWEHDHKNPFADGIPIGHTTHLEETEKGLFFRAVVIPTSKGKDISLLVDAGSLDEASFAYHILDKEFLDDGTRALKTLDIVEVTIATWGVNPETVVEVASSHPESECNPEIEQCLNALDMVSALYKIQRIMHV